MNRQIAAAVMAAAVILLTAPARRAAAEGLKAGNWETTVSMEMDGMSRSLPPTTFTHCITPDMVKDWKAVVSQTQRENSGCEIKDVNVEGSKVTWSVECHKQNDTKGTGEMTFGAESYEGTIHMEIENPRHGPMKMTMHLRAKRIGNCP